MVYPAGWISGGYPGWPMLQALKTLLQSFRAAQDQLATAKAAAAPTVTSCVTSSDRLWQHLTTCYFLLFAFSKVYSAVCLLIIWPYLAISGLTISAFSFEFPLPVAGLGRDRSGRAGEPAYGAVPEVPNTTDVTRFTNPDWVLGSPQNRTDRISIK